MNTSEENIVSGNYCAHIYEHCNRQAEFYEKLLIGATYGLESGYLSGKDVKPELVADIENSLQSYKALSTLVVASQKFLLPENGKLLDIKKYNEQYSDLLHIPFHSIALEITITDYPKNIEGHTTNKAVLFAWTKESVINAEKNDKEHFPLILEDDSAIHFTQIFFHTGLNDWQVCPAYAAFIPSKINVLEGKEKRIENIVGDANFMATYRQHPEEELKGMIKEMVQTGFNTLLQFCLTVNCENISKGVIEPNEKQNKKRIRNGKIPFFSYNYLKLTNEKGEYADKGGTHASPRAHVRRGHLRRLPTGKTTWVRHSYIGDAALGAVDKAYVLQGK